MKVHVSQFLLPLSLFLCLSSLVLWISVPELWPLNTTLLALGLLIGLGWAWPKRSEILSFASSLWAREFSRSVCVLVLLGGILGLVNYMTYKHPFQFDLSPQKSQELSAQAKKLLKSIPDAKLILFARTRDQLSYRETLEKFRIESNQISLEFIDPDLRPLLVKKYEIMNLPALIVQGPHRFVRAKKVEQTAIVSALANLSRKKAPVVAFLNGHGEASINEKGPNGLFLMSEKIKASGHEVYELSLVQNTLPLDDVDVFISLNPTKPFLKQEIDILDSALLKGKSVVIGLSPNLKKKAEKGGLLQFLDQKGLLFTNEFVVDTQSHIQGSQGLAPIVESYDKSHSLTQDFRLITFLPLASSIVVQTGLEDWKAKALAFSSPFPASWSETNPQEIIDQKMTFSSDTDHPGPAPLVAISEGDQRKNLGKVLLFASGTFVQNSYSGQGGNFDFFLNSVDYLNSRFEMIAPERHETQKSWVALSGIEIQLIFAFSVVILPLCFLLRGALIWRRRVLV